MLYRIYFEVMFFIYNLILGYGLCLQSEFRLCSVFTIQIEVMFVYLQSKLRLCLFTISGYVFTPTNISNVREHSRIDTAHAQRCWNGYKRGEIGRRESFLPFILIYVVFSDSAIGKVLSKGKIIETSRIHLKKNYLD